MPDAGQQLTLYYHPLSSYCWKVLLALYEADIPFLAERIDGPPGNHAALIAFWPVGKMPLLHDRARNQAIPESSIIIEYLQHHAAGLAMLVPESADAALEVRLWDRFLDCHVHTPMQKRVLDRLRPEHQKDPAGAADAARALDTAYQMLEERMSTRTWIASDSFSMADCAALPALFYADAVQPFRQSHPALGRYVDRLLDRPTTRRIIDEARPFFRFFPYRDGLDPRFLGPSD